MFCFCSLDDGSNLFSVCCGLSLDLWVLPASNMHDQKLYCSHIILDVINIKPLIIQTMTHNEHVHVLGLFFQVYSF